MCRGVTSLISFRGQRAETLAKNYYSLCYRHRKILQDTLRMQGKVCLGNKSIFCFYLGNSYEFPYEFYPEFLQLLKVIGYLCNDREELNQGY